MDRLAQHSFGSDQRIRRLSLTRLGVGDLFVKLLAGLGNLAGHRHRVFQFLLAGLTTLFELGNSLTGRVQTQPPARDFLGHGLRAFGARLTFAAQLIQRGAMREHGDPRRLDPVFDLLNLGARLREIPKSRLRRFGIFQLQGCSQRVLIMARDSNAKVFELAFGEVLFRLSAAQGTGTIRDALIGGAAGLTGGLIRKGHFFELAHQGLMRGLRTLGAGRGMRQILFQRLQPVHLLQSHRRRRGRIFGPRAEPVPAPQIALQRHQTLAGLQQRLQTRRLVRVNHADLCNPPPERIRTIDIFAQRLHPIRQRRITFIGRQGEPARRPIAIRKRRAQIIRQCGAKGFLVARCHPQIIHDLTALSGVTLNQLCQRRDLGPERAQLPLRLRAFRTRFGFMCLRFSAQLIRLGQRLFCRLGGFAGLFLRLQSGLIGSLGRS